MGSKREVRTANMYQDPNAIERWEIILGGIVAFSGLRI